MEGGGSLTENIALVATGVLAALAAIFKYLKTDAGGGKAEAAAEAGTVVAASFLDSRLVKELIDALREHSEEFARENKKALRSNQDVREAVQECTEAVLSQTDATLNMIRFIKGRQSADVQ